MESAEWLVDPSEALNVQFTPIVARTRTIHRPIGPVAFDCVKLSFVRAGSASVVSEFGQQRVREGDAVLLCPNTLCGSAAGKRAASWVSGRQMDVADAGAAGAPFGVAVEPGVRGIVRQDAFGIPDHIAGGGVGSPASHDHYADRCGCPTSRLV